MRRYPPVAFHRVAGDIFTVRFPAEPRAAPTVALHHVVVLPTALLRDEPVARAAAAFAGMLAGPVTAVFYNAAPDPHPRLRTADAWRAGFPEPTRARGMTCFRRSASGWWRTAIAACSPSAA